MGAARLELKLDWPLNRRLLCGKCLFVNFLTHSPKRYLKAKIE